MISKYSLSDKKILITGASSGIGRKCALICAELGANLVVSGRSCERLKSLVDEIGPQRSTSLLTADLSVSTDVAKLAEFCGNLDGIVHAAGILKYNLTRFITDQTIGKTFETNFFSIARLIKLLSEKKKINTSSSIVFIGSISQKLGVPATGEYAASKAALVSYSKVLASELAKKKIRVNTILPGLVETPMTLSNDTLLDPNMLEVEAKSYPLGIGKPDDVGYLCAFLLSEASRWMTGSEIVIDGGYTLNR
jgi:NAD(P)-dependent dehydrogenase (short-subunit alcohol dehydrogenase family)